MIDELLDLARRAPSAGFAQGTDFVVLDDGDAVCRFWELTADPRFPREPDKLQAAPPVLVLALADQGRYLAHYSEPDKIAFGLGRADAWPVEFWDTDTAMACMLLLLAAVDMGLGGWLFGVNRPISCTGPPPFAGEVPESGEERAAERRRSPSSVRHNASVTRAKGHRPPPTSA